MTIFYHGNQSKFDKFKQGKPWLAFDGKTIQRPVWLSPDKEFARLYAGQHGYLYTVDYQPKKSFPDHELVEMRGRYVELTPFGESLRDDLMTSGVFDDEDEAESIVKDISNLGYDVLETSFMVEWFKNNGYTSFQVRGDGPTNLAVMDIQNIKIVSVEEAYPDTLQELKKFVKEQVQIQLAKFDTI